MTARGADWNPETYSRFRDLRLRPALDLLGRVGDLPDGAALDLGCGNGAAGPALAHRYRPGRRLIGLDASPNMLDAAGAKGCYDDLIPADVTEWRADTPLALIFSNAALQWLPDHAGLFPRLAGYLAPGGTLAVQMPRQYGAPSHRFLRDFAADMFPDRFPLADRVAPVAPPVDYHRMLSTRWGRSMSGKPIMCSALAPSDNGHPVRRFTEATAMRPYLDRMNGDEIAAFLSRYDKALEAAYPVEADGSVLFPFRRLFFTLTV
ncbi:MAG: methyltransferase domain-containing protein [Defluviimonas denitrificans]